MLIDRIENAAAYHGLGERFRRALEFLAAPGLEQLPAGRHEIDGDRVFALVQAYETRPRSTGAWEAHRRYADIQYLVEGEELIGWANTAGLAESRPYAADGDCALFDGDGVFPRLEAGSFAIFFPWDAHMPGIAAGQPAPARKIVVKVRVEP